MAKLNGHAAFVKWNASTGEATKVAGQTESSISFTTETEDVTTKDSSVDETTGRLFPEEEITTVGAEVSMTCLKDATTKLGVVIGTTGKWAFVSGGDSYSGNGIVTSVNESAPVKGKATVQITIKSKGAITGI